MGRAMMRIRLARVAEQQAKQMEAHERRSWERFREIIVGGRPETWEAMDQIIAAQRKYGGDTPEAFAAAEPWLRVVEAARERLGLEW